MKKIFAFLIVFVIICAGVLAVVKNKHHRQRATEAHKIKQIKRMAQMVRFMYKNVCSNREATIIAVALSIKELGKKGKIDAPKYLRQILEKLKKQSLRNFVRFLIVDSYKEKKQAQEMVGELMNLVDENIGKKTKKSVRKTVKKAKAPINEKKEQKQARDLVAQADKWRRKFVTSHIKKDAQRAIDLYSQAFKIFETMKKRREGPNGKNFPPIDFSDEMQDIQRNMHDVQKAMNW